MLDPPTEVRQVFDSKLNHLVSGPPLQPWEWAQEPTSSQAPRQERSRQSFVSLLAAQRAMTKTPLNHFLLRCREQEENEEGVCVLQGGVTGSGSPPEEAATVCRLRWYTPTLQRSRC